VGGGWEKGKVKFKIVVEFYLMSLMSRNYQQAARRSQPGRITLDDIRLMMDKLR